MNAALVRRALAEAGGTAVLVAVGTGTVVAAARWGGIDLGVLSLAWFAAVLLPILLVVRASGAHLNPAVTLALTVSGRFSVRELPAYWAGQFVGAFSGSAIVGVVLGTDAHLGATLPGTTALWAVFVGEAVFTALLVASVFVLADRGPGRHRWRLALPPAAVGVSTAVIGPFTGSSLNPARSVAPAVLSGAYTDLWVYLVAVAVGAVVVALMWRPAAVDRFDRGVGVGVPPIADELPGTGGAPLSGPPR